MDPRGSVVLWPNRWDTLGPAIHAEVALTCSPPPPPEHLNNIPLPLPGQSSFSRIDQGHSQLCSGLGRELVSKHNRSQCDPTWVGSTPSGGGGSIPGWELF